MSFHELVADYPWLSKRAIRAQDPNHLLPQQHKLAWLFALFVPRLGKGGMLLPMIAFIGILAAISLPTYQNYVTRAKQLQPKAQTSGLNPEISRIFEDDKHPTGVIQKQSESKQVVSEDESLKIETAPVNSNPSFEQRIQVAVDVIKKSTPKMIDVYTRFEGVKAESGKINLTYTLVNISTPEQLPSQLFKATFEPSLKQSTCASPLFKPLIDDQVTILYQYRGQNGFQVGTVVIDRNTCPN